MNKTLSCGLIIEHQNHFLVGHVTGQKHYDIFKGGIDDGETPYDAMIREVREESGIDVLSLLKKFPELGIKDLGHQEYYAKKDLHAFVLNLHDGVDWVLELGPLHCDCYCEFPSRKNMGEKIRIPEMDGFKWVDIKDITENKGVFAKAMNNFLIRHMASIKNKSSLITTKMV